MSFMHWMQRIHRPTARKQCIDEGYRLGSGDIAYRKRRVSILYNCAIPIRRGVQVRLSLDFPALDRSGMPFAFRPGIGPGRILGVRCCHSLEFGQDRHFLKVPGAEARPVDACRCGAGALDADSPATRAAM